jgi:hypothetical protein
MQLLALTFKLRWGPELTLHWAAGKRGCNQYFVPTPTPLRPCAAIAVHNVAMADWAETYLAALRKRDEVEKANVELYDYCAKLADQRAELLKQTRNVGEEKPATSPPGFGLRRVASPTRPESPGVSQMRADLTKAQAERAELQGKLEGVSRELEVLKGKSKLDTRKMGQLQASVNQLSLKVRDREEELKGKAKLVEDVQDENVTLNLQLNMAEERGKVLKKENEELVERWMKRMGVEAERMNEEGNFKNLRGEKG